MALEINYRQRDDSELYAVVRNIGGRLKCTCFEFQSRNSCRHTDDVIENNIIIDRWPEGNCPKLADVRKEMQDRMMIVWREQKRNWFIYQWNAYASRNQQTVANSNR